MSVDFIKSEKLIEYKHSLILMQSRVKDIHLDIKNELVWFLEHQDIYTAGISAKNTDLLDDKIPTYHTNRGGQYTYHGPGQRVAYLLLNLKKRKLCDVKKYVYDLEEIIINTLQNLNIYSYRKKGIIGVWTKDINSKEKKIAAVGVRMSKWVTYHGIAINLSTDLSKFNKIVPCGIKDKGVTSIHAIKQSADITMQILDLKLKKNIYDTFSL